MMEGHSGGMLTMPDGQPGMPMMGDGQPGMAMMADAMPSSNGCRTRLRGLPFAASEQEIQMWFSSAPGGRAAGAARALHVQHVGPQVGRGVHRATR